MTRDRYALPWPPDADPPEPVIGEGQSTLWLGSCPVCAGSGVVALSVFGLDAEDEIACRECGGSGVGAETLRRRPMP